VITTEYGTWATRSGGYAARVEDTVLAVIGEFVDDYDFKAIMREYRAEINAALPDGVTLDGEIFYGPYAAPGVELEWPGYPTEDDGRLDLFTIIHGVDLWPIIERHDRSEKEETMHLELVLIVSPLGGRITAQIGADLFWVELVDHSRNLFVWGINIGGPTVFHARMTASSDWDALDMAHVVLTDPLLYDGPDRELPAAVLEWVNANATTLERVRAFCGPTPS
jgi:hypothetical protein